MEINQIIALLCAASTFIILFCIVLVILRNRVTAIKGFLDYIFLLGSFVVGNMFYIVDTLSADADLKMSMFKLQYIFIISAIVFYTRFFRINIPDLRRSFALRGVLEILIPMIYGFFIWIDPGKIFFGYYWVQTLDSGISILEIDFQNAFLVTMGVIYLFFLYYIGRVLFSWVRGEIIWQHAFSMFFSVVVLIVANGLYLLEITRMDLTNILAAASAAFITHCILQYGVLDPMPYVKNNILTLFSEPLFVLTAGGRVEYANPAAEEMMDAPLSGMQGKDLREIHVGFSANALASGEIVLDEEPPLYYKLSETPLLDKQGKLYGRILIAYNISDQINASQKLEYMSTFDVATGLLNAEAFAKTLERYRTASLTGLGGTYLFAVAVENAAQLLGIMTMEQKRKLDLSIAEYIRDLVPAPFVLSKYGENEYYMFSNGVDIDQEEFFDLFYRTSHKVFPVDDRTVNAEFKMGAYCVTDPSISVKEALTNASYALSSVLAKRQALEVYSFEMARQHELHKILLTSLDSLNYEKDFYLEFQPIVDIKRNKVAGAEALLRWNHPAFGLISPAVFMPVLENANEMRALGNAVLAKACDAMIEWKGLLAEDFKLSINVSKKQIDAPELAEDIQSILREKAVDPHMLDFEITETATSSSIQNVIRFSKFIKGIGGSVSIDDFGSGDTSIAYITELAPDKVKFDMSLSENSHLNFQRGVVVKSLLDMCSNLGIAVVVEHVESVKALAKLREQGFSLIQGYIYSRSLSRENFIRYYGTFNERK